MKTIAMMLVVAMALAACGGCDTEPPKDFGLEVVEVRFFKSHNTTHPWDEYKVKVRIYGHGDYPGVGQVVTARLSEKFTGGPDIFPDANIIEYFDISGHGWRTVYDTHKDLIGASHEMTLFPASVEGVDMNDKGFAMLPESEDGAIQFSPAGWQGEGMNPEYVRDHEVRGKFRSTKRSAAIRWRIDTAKWGLTVTINGKETRYEANEGNIENTLE